MMAAFKSIGLRLRAFLCAPELMSSLKWCREYVYEASGDYPASRETEAGLAATDAIITRVGGVQ